MKIDKQKIYEQDLSFFDEEIGNFSYLKSDKEHYKLLSYLSKQYNDITIIDAGTNFGHSALALSQNENNKVRTYDLIDNKLTNITKYKNIEFFQKDINEESKDIFLNSEIILLDIDPHDGKQEEKFYIFLKEINFKGYLICDDIFLNQGMRDWWESIEIEKYDVTEVGHFSGTGIVNFKEDKNFSFL